MPVILDNQAPSQHNVVYWQVGSHDDPGAQWAVRKGSWKLIGNVKEPSGQGEQNDLPPLFLSNLEEDVSEQNNLADSHPQGETGTFKVARGLATFCTFGSRQVNHSQKVTFKPGPW